MKIRVVFFLLFIIQGYSYSQPVSRISGKVYDSISSTPLPYATILLKTANDTVITECMTNEKGEFSIENTICSDSLYLSALYTGYNEKNIRLSLYFKNSDKIYLNEIYLSLSETLLKEITVDEHLNYIEKKFDRKIFNISDNKISAARTVLDLLRTLPGVVVNQEGTVYFKGAEATIYVDDQLMKFIYPKIEMIPVDKINKIELIDIAMRSGGDGRGGIINIKFRSTKSFLQSFHFRKDTV